MGEFLTEIKIQWLVVGKYDNHYLTLKVPNFYGWLILASVVLSFLEVGRKVISHGRG